MANEKKVNNQHLKTEKKKKPLPKGEVSSIEVSGKNALTNLGNQELFTDDILNEIGGDITTYKKLLQDTEVKTGLEQRKNAVIACEWAVYPAGDSAEDKKAAEALELEIKALKFDSICRKMLAGVFYGYAVAEVLWGWEDGYVTIADIKVRKQERFRIDYAGKLYLQNGFEKQPMPERKFWTFVTGADDDDTPMGQGLAYWLYWPVWFKKNGVRFWAVYLEKYAKPTARAKHPNTADDKTKDAALAAAEELGLADAVAHSADFEVDLVEAARASNNNYEKFIEYWDGCIDKLILGQEGTTNIGPYVGTAETHSKTMRDYQKADSNLLCESLNDTIIKWWAEANFPNANPPQIYKIVPNQEATQNMLNQDKMMHDMGYRVREDEIAQRYGDIYEKIPANELKTGLGSLLSSTTASGTNNFADVNPIEFMAKQKTINNKNGIDDLTAQLAEATKDDIAAMVQVVRDLVFSENITSLEQLQDELATLYPKMRDGNLTANIGLALEIAAMMGAGADGD